MVDDKMMQITQETRGNIFQHGWRSLKNLFRTNTKNNTVSFSSDPLSPRNLQTTNSIDNTEKGLILPTPERLLFTALFSNANKAAVLLEPFNSFLIKQFSLDDVYILKRGLERKLESGIAVDDIQRQLQLVMDIYKHIANINNLFDSLANICGVIVLHVGKIVEKNNSEKSLQISLGLFNKKFSNPCELTQKLCLSLPLDVLAIVLNNFEATRRFMHDNGLIFEQLKWLAESSSGYLKLEILLNDDRGLIRLREHDIAFEQLAELDLDDFKILLSDKDSDKVVELFRALQSRKMDFL